MLFNAMGLKSKIFRNGSPTDDINNRAIAHNTQASKEFFQSNDTTVLFYKITSISS